MRALPRVTNPISWRKRAECKERNRQSASFERRMQALAVANQIRRELREERKQRKSA